MRDKRNAFSDDSISVMACIYVGIALIIASSMVKHWHATPAAQKGTWGELVLDSTSSVGAILMVGSFLWLIFRKGAFEAQGKIAGMEDERVRHIQGQAALFAVTVMFFVLGLFPAFANYFREVSSASLSYAAMLILMGCWIGRLLWLNRE